METQHKTHLILKVILLSFVLAGFLSANSFAAESEGSDPNQSSKYLDAVREFADNVLKYGRDTYGPKHTPLFVDGVNVNTHEPVEWISPKGNVLRATETKEWILSNFAFQQTLLRTLDGLSAITGEPQYRDAAMQATRYAFDNLRSPNGLLYWGHVAAYDASNDVVYSYNSHHTLKLHYPYYELMWKVDSNATREFIEAFWSGHINDWSILDMNRWSFMTINLEEPWDHEYNEAGPTFFKSKYGGRGFYNTATSLVQAGTTLYSLSEQEQPLVWSKRLMKRFIDTRHPNTGITAHIYNNPWLQLGEDMKEHFTDPYTTVFPWQFYEYRYLYFPENVLAHPWISILLVGEMLGEDGNEFTQWALEELTAWGKASYRKQDNSFIPMLTDGTSLEGYVWKDGPGNSTGLNVIKPYPADLSFFWAYSAAYRTTGNEFMWEMLRDIALGNDFGDIGKTSAQMPKLRVDTTCSDVYGLLGFLELYNKTNKSEFLQIARRIGDNIVENQFYKGFFVLSKKHIYTRFDCYEPLALLHLYVAIKSEPNSVPRVWPSMPLFVPPYRFKQEGEYHRIIYALTELPKPPLSLQEAASIGDMELVEALIENGAGVDNLDDSYVKTALHRAAISGHKNVAELLLAKGAGVDARDWGCQTPLHYAAEEGHKEIAELLIAKGADINAKNRRGQTPLDIAMRRNRKEIVELLRTKGAFMDISSIHLAAQAGDLAKVLSFLEKGTDVNEKDKDGSAPLHLAVSGDHKDVIVLLLSKGADVNAKDKRGYTPLFYAIWNTNKELVDLLVSKGADINITPEKGYPPLYFAVWMADLDIVKILVEQGAKFDVKAMDGWTAFRYAVAQGSRDIVEFFVSKGADVSTLHGAACMGDLGSVKSFLEQGTDVDTKDELGWTALYWAASTGQESVAEYLIDNGANVNANTNDNRTPLHQAAQSGAVKLVESLISHSADVNAPDKRGYTPLHRAASAGHREVVEILIDNGANIDAKRSDNGRTPLHSAAVRGHRDIVRLLLVKGADANAQDNWGRTPMSLAKQKGHTEIIELLQKHMLAHDVAVANVSVPSSCTKGDIVSTVVSVENQGDYSESFEVTLADVAEGSEIGRKSLTLTTKDKGGTDADVIFTGEPNTTSRLGLRVLLGKDINGDGYRDMFIGAPYYKNIQGRVYIYYGGENATLDVPDLTLTGEGDNDYFGHDIETADFNNDGYADMAITALGYNSFQGRVYIYYGGPGFDTTADKIFDGEPSTAGRFGRRMAAGDINNDGCAELLVCADELNSNRGRVYLYYGAPGTDMDTTCDLVFDGEKPEDLFGKAALALGKDVDGDGYGDVLIGTRVYPKGRNDGRVYLYWGAEGTGMDNICDLIFNNQSAGEQYAAIDVFDINNDGFADIIIGAQTYDRGRGRVYLHWGAERTNMDTIPDKYLTGENVNSLFGAEGIYCGYVNNDDYGDILVPAVTYDRRKGRAYLFYGNTKSEMDVICDMIFTGEYINDRFASDVAVGDINGDNLADVLIGARMFKNESFQGRAYLYYGGSFKWSTDITFNWDTTNASVGTHILKAEIASIAGEEDTADNTMTITVEVTEPTQ